MDYSTLKDHINEITELAFAKLQYSYVYHREKPKDNQLVSASEEDCFTRLVFPSYSNENYDIRISEQELRFSFVEAFCQYCKSNNVNLYYSIETPTRGKYSGFSKTKDEQNPIPQIDDKGRSGEFDMVIYNEELVRVCLIEFKANNASNHDHKKDFVKLNNLIEGDNNVLRYFIEVVDSYRDTTVKSLRKKIVSKNGNVAFVCYSLNQGEDITPKII